MDNARVCAHQRKEYNKARPLLRKAAEGLWTSGRVHYHLGLTDYHLGRKEDAVFSLRRALQLDDKAPEAKEARQVLSELVR